MSSYEISKSSLLSLKAEILRKQEDLTRVKHENIQKFKSLKKTPLEIKNKGVEERQLKDLDEEEQDLLKLSKTRLEAKSKLYDKLSVNSHKEGINKQYLVRFDKKEKLPDEFDQDTVEVPDFPVDNEDNEDEENHLSDYYDEAIDPSDEWVEYTDCLGRTRKCLRKDLEYIKSRDADLRLSVPQRRQSCEDPKTESTNINDNSTDMDGPSETVFDESEMISGDMRREILRKQWEMEEEELRNKTDIHYQNVLFNEARVHGVGYYAFSKDDDERAKQQAALKQIRLETEQKQKKARDLKALRDKQMAARMKAARNRRRARLGLPPEEDEPEPTSDVNKELEEKEKGKEEKEKLDQEEQILMEARKRHVRPWDIGKKGAAEFYQMTQEEWNDKKRHERPTEFAPPMTYSKREFSSLKTLDYGADDSDKTLRFSTKGHKETELKKSKLTSINRYKFSKTSESKGDNLKETNESNLRNDDRLIDDYTNSESFTNTKNKTHESENAVSEGEHYKTSRMEPTPIYNEVDDTTEFEDFLLADYNKVKPNNIPEKEMKFRKKGAEIPPPPTFEYFGPTETKKARRTSEQINIAESINAGLRFLRQQAEGKKRQPDL